jgi:ELWxxDGT repeat protein
MCGALSPASLAQVSIERPTLVKNINTAPEYDPLTPVAELNGLLIFAAFTRGSGWELWRSDGSEWGAVRIKDIPKLWIDPLSLTEAKGRLFFTTRDWENNSPSLWTSDGTADGTVSLRKFSAGASGYDLPYYFTVNSTLFFGRPGSVWMSDGTMPGTVHVAALAWENGPENELEINGTAFFTVFASGAHELWKSDGTLAGTTPLHTFPRVSTSAPYSLGAANGTLLFSVYDKTSGQEPWRSDGTAAGTYALSDPAGPPLVYYTHFFYPSVMVEANGTIFFRADDGVTGFELWKFGDPDKDSDGLPDWWENRFFSQNVNPEEDPDGDGMNNWEESRAGTDPTNPGSVLKLT